MLGDDTLAPPFLSSESLSVEEEELSDFDRLKKKKKKQNRHRPKIVAVFPVECFDTVLTRSLL